MRALDASEAAELLHLARATLEVLLTGAPSAPIEPRAPSLLEPRAAYVTLFVGGEQRGCVGELEPRAALHRTIAKLSVEAATRDPRFAPLRADELSTLRIVVSLLSPREHVSDLDTIEVGRHGVIVERGRRRSLMLPQVALEQGWDREKLLSETCYKAFLPRDAWRDAATRVERFTAEIVSE